MAIFPSVLSYLHHESWVHKTRNFSHDTTKTGSTPNYYFSITIIPLRNIFKFENFYTSDLNILYLLFGPRKGNLMHGNIIFAAPKFCF